MKTLITLLAIFFISNVLFAQNSMVGDGFGGRKWYKPYNYTVGSYSAYTICGDDKQLYGWGANSFGQLGDGTYNSTVNPVKVINMNHVKYYSTGYVMGAIKDDETGWVWGRPSLFDTARCTPKKVIDDVKFVDAGINSSVFVKNDGTVWSVGSNILGEFGNGIINMQFAILPEKMLNVTNAVRVAQGEQSTTVLLSDGSLMVAGNYLGINYIEPFKINLNVFFIDIKANAFENLALDSSGNVWFWNQSTMPEKLNSVENIVAISGCNDGFHFLLLDENHDCYAIGNNIAGQCGTAINMNLGTPVKVASDVNDIMAGEWFSYIVKSDGQLYASGASNGGSIWLNIENKQRAEFTRIDPTDTSINLCGVDNDGEYGEAHIPNPIIPQPIIDTPTIFFPNAFSPNSDSKNDVFKAICADKSNIEKYDLRIVNRYGQLVFHTNNIDKGWDGKNTELSTYFYYCRYKQFNKNSIDTKGDVTIVK